MKWVEYGPSVLLFVTAALIMTCGSVRAARRARRGALAEAHSCLKSMSDAAFYAADRLEEDGEHHQARQSATRGYFYSRAAATIKSIPGDRV